MEKNHPKLKTYLKTSQVESRYDRNPWIRTSLMCIFLNFNHNSLKKPFVDDFGANCLYELWKENISKDSSMKDREVERASSVQNGQNKKITINWSFKKQNCDALSNNRLKIVLTVPFAPLLILFLSADCSSFSFLIFSSSASRSFSTSEITFKNLNFDLCDLE